MTWRPACPANLCNSRLCWTPTSDGKLRALPLSKMLQTEIHGQQYLDPHRCDHHREAVAHMYRLIRENTMQSCFTNVEILLRVYLCMMVTNCTGERSFSKLRRINNAQRSTNGQGRLNMLILMSIESELLRTIDGNSIIDDFARVIARKHNM